MLNSFALAAIGIGKVYHISSPLCGFDPYIIGNAGGLYILIVTTEHEVKP